MTLNKMIFTLAIAATGVGILPASLWAHDFFLIAQPPHLSETGESVIGMHVTDEFPGEPTGWRADKVTHMTVRGPNSATLPTWSWPPQDAPGVALTFESAGTYLLAVDTSASSISLPAKDFHDYIKHEGHDQLLAQRSKGSVSDKPVRERYTRFLKTMVTCQHPSTAHAIHLMRPVGQRLEIVPLAEISSLRSGQALLVQVLYEGKPLSGALLAATHSQHGQGKTDEHDHSSEHYAFSARTNDQGQVSVPISHAGLQLIRVTHMVQLVDHKEFDYDSFWASLTLFVNSNVE